MRMFLDCFLQWTYNGEQPHADVLYAGDRAAVQETACMLLNTHAGIRAVFMQEQMQGVRGSAAGTACSPGGLCMQQGEAQSFPLSGEWLLQVPEPGSECH